MTREELTIQIERYLDGELSAEEAKKLELLIVADDKIAAEIDFHKNLREGIKLYYNRLQLRDKFKEWENDKSFPVKQKQKSGLWRPILAAASISLLVTVGGVSLYHYTFRNNIDDKLNNSITQLNRTVEKNKKDINEIKTQQPASVEMEMETPTNIATAFAITADGYVVTSKHVVGNKKFVTIEQKGDSLVKYKAKVISVNDKLDFALLKIVDKSFVSLPKIPYSFSSREIDLAQHIYALGYPKNDIVYAEGAVSSLSGLEGDTTFYQLDIIAANGYSGSPIINERGELLGVISGKKTDADGETYCTKMKYIIKFLADLEEKNKDLKLTLNTKSKLKGKSLPQQVKTMLPFVFIVKA